tara:strand:+ start:285 stop:542 length:258 start_codon:yes stop_codon:yes gene_type:complete
MRLATRFKDKECIIKETSSEWPWTGVINKITREAGEAFYEIESEGEVIILAVSSVEWIKLRKGAKILEINKLNIGPLRTVLGSGN